MSDAKFVHVQKWCQWIGQKDEGSLFCGFSLKKRDAGGSSLGKRDAETGEGSLLRYHHVVVGLVLPFSWFKLVLFGGNMSVLTEEQVTVHKDAASSDIKFLLDKEDVDRLTQPRLYEAGVLTSKQFAEEKRETAVKELGLEMKTLKDKAKLSKLLVAFEVAKGRSSSMAEVEGESAVKELPKALATPDYHSLREAYEKKFCGD